MILWSGFRRPGNAHSQAIGYSRDGRERGTGRSLLSIIYLPWLDAKKIQINVKDGSRTLVAHTCNPSYGEGRDKEDHGLKPAQENSLRAPISKISPPPPYKRAGGVGLKWYSACLATVSPWVQTPIPLPTSSEKLKMGFLGPKRVTFVKDKLDSGAKHMINPQYLWIDYCSKVNCTLLNGYMKILYNLARVMVVAIFQTMKLIF
jgi:hypothetical protein